MAKVGKCSFDEMSALGSALAPPLEPTPSLRRNPRPERSEDPGAGAGAGGAFGFGAALAFGAGAVGGAGWILGCFGFVDSRTAAFLSQIEAGFGDVTASLGFVEGEICDVAGGEVVVVELGVDREGLCAAEVASADAADAVVTAPVAAAAADALS